MNKVFKIFGWLLLSLFGLFLVLLFNALSEVFNRNECPNVPEYVIAHRGLHLNAPENSLEAVQKALDHNLKSIEIDVHQTADSQLVVLHDYTISLENGSVMIGEKTYEELLDANVRLPLLNEVIDLINGRAQLIVELKTGHSFYPGIEKNVAQLINESSSHGWVSVHSFSDEVLTNLASLDSSIELHKLLVCYLPELNLIIDEGIHFKSLESYDYISAFSIAFPFANETLINRCHKLGKKVNVWNLNDASLAGKFTQMNVDGIITDQPLELLSKIHE